MATMDPETLVTFIFKAHSGIRTVELLGSWDNFSRPYAMYNDRRRGPGFWSGCFKFQDIVFDGVEVNWSRPRTGGLKQGGTYWYYFRLDDDMEAYDDFRECTTACPLMPGQMVNVMFVPRELVESPFRNRSASVNLAGSLARIEETHTMEPEAKFAALEPPAPSKVHDRCVSDLALDGRLEGRPVSRSSVESPRPSGEIEDTTRTDCQSISSSRPAMESSEPVVKPYPAVCAQSAVTMCGVLDPPSPRTRSGHPSRPPSRHAELPSAAALVSNLSSSADVQLHKDVGDNRPVLEESSTTCETSSLGPHSVAEVHFHSDNTAIAPSHNRHYSLHNADLIPQLQPSYTTCSTSSISPVYSPVNHGSPVRPGTPTHERETCFSPTTTATTASSSGGEINTPFYLGVANSDRDPRAKTAWVNEDSFEDIAARLRSLEGATSPPRSNRQPPPPPVETYRPTGFTNLQSRAVLPRSYALPAREPTGAGSWSHIDSVRPSSNGLETSSLPLLTAGRGMGQEMSMADSILSELGYLGGAIR